MSKSILVIDTPNSCSKCDLALSCSVLNIQATQSVIHGVTKIHEKFVKENILPQCPLQPTDELLEALEELKTRTFITQEEGMKYGSYDKAVDNLECYNKLKSALGGKVDE